MANEPMSIPVSDWRLRWLYSSDPRAAVLHRVSSIRWRKPERDWGKTIGLGVTVCGVRMSLSVPGVLSRMGMPRCSKCCFAMGIPDGVGAPFNAKPQIKEADDE